MGAADGSIFTRHSLRAGGFEVSYLTGGYDGDVEPVLYLHGLGGGGKWEAFHMALGTAALTFAPQLPGWQEGRAPDGIRSVKDYSGLVAEFLEAIEIGRVVLVAPLGMAVPSAPASSLGDMDEETFAKAVFGRLGLIATTQPDGFGAEWENVRRGPEFERQWKGRELVAALVDGVCADAELTRQLPAITAQTLLVWGRLDGIVPLQHGEALQSALPNSRLNVIDRCGHLPMSEKPETFNRILRNFLVGDEEEISEVARV